MTAILQSGAGEIAGDDVALAAPLYMRATTWWVNSSGGVNGASPAGTSRLKPLATLEQAITNAAAGDLIFLMAGHAQVVTAAITISKSLSIVGGGSVDGKPGVTFATNSVAAGIFSITTAAVELRSIRLLTGQQANSASRITTNSAGTRLRNLYVESSAIDTGAGAELLTGGDNCRLETCTFLSTATAIASRPGRGLLLTNAVSDLELIRCTFDDGTVGYATAACDLSVAIPTRAKIEAVNLLHGADLLMHASSVASRISIGTVSGGGRVVW